MTSKSYVVMGEAEESDSEEEINSPSISSDNIEHSKGKTVFGEAPESDEEYCTNTGSVESVSSAVSALSAPTVKIKKRSKKHESILIKKLYERNVSLHKNLKEFIQEIATNAGNELNAADKRLLKCQLQMQESADYLRVLNSNLTALHANLEMILSANHLPNIRIGESSQHE